jgi:hypothetical protein
MHQQLEEGLYEEYKPNNKPNTYQASLMCLLAMTILVILGFIQYSAIVLVDVE